MEARANSTAPNPHGSATNGERFGSADPAVEHLDSKGDLALLTGPGSGVQLEFDQVPIAAHDGFCVVAPSILGRALPSDVAQFGVELDVTVARALLIRISCTQNGVGSGWSR